MISVAAFRASEAHAFLPKRLSYASRQSQLLISETVVCNFENLELYQFLVYLNQMASKWTKTHQYD